MMTRQKSRLKAAAELETNDRRAVEMPKIKSRERDLIGIKHKKLKELFADEFINDNDKNKPEKGTKLTNGKTDKNVDPLQPLMIMDKQLVSSETEAESENEVNEEQNVFQPMTEPLWKQRCEKNQRVLVERNFGRNNMKLIRTSRGLVKEITYDDIWYFIKPKPSIIVTYEQRQCLDFPLVKLANASTTMQLPSNKWSSKVTLYKISPSVLKRHTLTTFSGDLKIYQIPEKDRQKYQPSSVIFRREETTQQSAVTNHVTYDRVIIFKPNNFSINFDGNQVQFEGAPDSVACKQDVIRLLDIADSISISNPMVAIVKPK